MAYALQLVLCSVAIVGFLWIGSYPTALLIMVFVPLEISATVARIIGASLLLLYIIANGTVSKALTPYDKP